jgi:hypothetical protein
MKTKRFEIILPHPRTTKELIFDFFEIIFEEESPGKMRLVLLLALIYTPLTLWV